MKYLILFVLLILFSACDSLEINSNQSSQIDLNTLERVSFNKRPDVYMCPKDSCLEIFLNEIDKAQKEIKCALYEIDDFNLSNVLIEKYNSGIEVMLVIDNNYLEEEPFLELVEAGIATQDDRNRGTKYNNYMHHKFCIIDDSSLLLSSANPSPNGMYFNNNNVLTLNSQDLALEFEKEFDQLFRGIFGTNKNQLRSVRGGIFENETFDIYFCPSDNCEKGIIDVLNKAEEEIFFANFVLTLDSVEEVLLDKYSRGVNVSGVIEKRSWNSQGSRAEEMSKIFPLTKDKNSKTMHHKFYVIDSRYVVTGSMNPSNSGTKYNDEYMVVIDSSILALEFREEFLSLVN